MNPDSIEFEGGLIIFPDLKAILDEYKPKAMRVGKEGEIELLMWDKEQDAFAWTDITVAEPVTAPNLRSVN